MRLLLSSEKLRKAARVRGRDYKADYDSAKKERRALRRWEGEETWEIQARPGRGGDERSNRDFGELKAKRDSYQNIICLMIQTQHISHNSRLQPFMNHILGPFFVVVACILNLDWVIDGLIMKKKQIFNSCFLRRVGCNLSTGQMCRLILVYF